MQLFRQAMARFFVAVALLAPGTVSVSAQEFEKNILTGGPTGTYIQFGRDIASLMSTCGQTLNVVESAGSLENFLGVRKRRATQFGIVQSDVLEYLKTYSANDRAILRAIDGVRIAFPLYNEEVHLIAVRDVTSLEELQGKRVAVGVEDSGTFLTSLLLLNLLEITADVRPIGPDESMEQLLAGEIDAFFYVAGAPTRIFENDQIDAARFHLVPIDDPVLQSVYVPTEIPGGTYPFQDETIPVVAVKAVLMTYEFDPRKNGYHLASCRAVSDVSNLILTRFAQLRAEGHPKWQQVNLDDIPPGWDVAACVNAGLAANYKPNCSVPQATSSPESVANQAYRERICSVIGC